MKITISINTSQDTVANNGTQITDPRDLNKTPETASMTFTGFHYPGGLASLAKNITQWVEVHKDLDDLDLTKEEKAEALEKYLEKQDKK